MPIGSAAIVTQIEVVIDASRNASPENGLMLTPALGAGVVRDPVLVWARNAQIGLHIDFGIHAKVEQSRMHLVARWASSVDLQF